MEKCYAKELFFEVICRHSTLMNLIFTETSIRSVLLIFTSFVSDTPRATAAPAALQTGKPTTVKTEVFKNVSNNVTIFVFKIQNKSCSSDATVTMKSFYSTGNGPRINDDQAKGIVICNGYFVDRPMQWKGTWEVFNQRMFG